MSAARVNRFMTELMANHGTQLRRYLLNRVRNRADVPDLSQEVFLRMLRVPDHDAIRSPEAYLFTIAQHVVHQHAIRESRLQPSAEVQEMLLEFSQPPCYPEVEVDTQQIFGELECALQRLSPRERATFLYHRRDGLTLQHIADRFGVSRQMVKKYLAKAVLELRRHLSRTQ